MCGRSCSKATSLSLDAALAELSLLSPGGSGTLGSFNIPEPVFRTLPYTEGQERSIHYLLFSQKGIQLLHHSTQAISASSAKIFLHWCLPWDKHVALECLARQLRLAWRFILLASKHGLYIINQQHTDLDVICFCVTFNSCKVKM